jgi:tetratricopeptide (TPR) repeat protein
MSNLSFKIILLLLTLFWCFECPAFPGQEPDTLSINTQTRDALTSARRNPDLSIYLAHKALSESKSIQYRKGIADASYALGSAYLAKYNIHDSATYYNMKAYDTYRELGDDRGKARTCYGLAYVYSFKGNLQESERYGALSLNFFEKAGDKRGMINAYNALSYLAKQQKDFIKARGLIEQAIETARSVKDTLPLADAMNSLGNIYKDMALFSQAIDTYFDALKLWELKKDSAGIAIAYGSIGLMYYFQKNWNKALEFNFRKMPVSEAAGDLWEVSKTCNNIAQIYNSKAEYDSAIIYMRKSLKLNKKMNYPSGIAASYYNFANTFLLYPNTDSAYFYITLAVNLAKQINDPSLANYYVTLGRIQKAKGNYLLALENTLSAYKIAKKQNQPILLSECSELLSNIYSAMKHNDLAYIYLKEHQQLQDSISNDDFRNRVTRLEIQYEYDKKQRAAEYAQMEERLIRDNKIKQKDQYVKGLLIIIILVILVSYSYIRHNRLRSQYARIEIEQRLLRTQMNPHFIFNSLCAVQDFILADKPRKANTYLTKIARLMRYILENSGEEFIPIEKEIETIRLYLDVQQLRFETEFEYKITLDPSIDPGNFSIPPMFTQPCVENSIEHGLLPSDRKGKLNINYSLNNGLMKLEVTDNGVGRKEAEKITGRKQNKQSVSTRLTSQRLAYFRKTLRKKNIIYETIDLQEKGKASGTKVIMMLPYRKIFT